LIQLALFRSGVFRLKRAGSATIRTEKIMLLEVLIAVVLLYIAAMCYFNKLHQKFLVKNRPPLITGFIPYLGVALQFGKDPKGYQDKMREIYGDIFTLYVMGSDITVFKSPHDIHKIYSQPKKFDFQQISNRHASHTFGMPLISMEKSHEAHHQLTSHLQNYDLDYLTGRAKERLEEMLFKPNDNKSWTEVDLYKWVSYIIVSVTTRSMFGDNMDIEGIMRDYFPFDHNFGILASNVPDALKKDAIQKRTNYAKHFALVKPNDDATDMIKERHELFSAEAQGDPLVMGHSLAVINWVAKTNTLGATYWCMYYLMKLPRQVKDQIMEEVKTVLGEPQPNKKLPEMTHESLSKLKKLDALFDEVLRITFSTMSTRVVCMPLDFTAASGKVYHLEKNDFLMLSNSHYDGEIFQDPEVFKWDRFLDMGDPIKDGKQAKLSASFIPFGGGLSKCPGNCKIN
jgi:cytochrome P450